MKFTFINRLIDKSKWKRIVLSLGFIVVASGPILRPLWQVQWYPMHDTTHIARAYLMEQTIKNGQIPPLWTDSANEGYGYPLFHFYAPLVYYLAILIKQFVPTYILSFKLTLSLFTLFGASGMYLLLRKWGRVGALLGTAAFLTLPYAALNLYVRGAFAEYAGLMLLPWLFYVWRQPQKGKQIYITSLITSLFFLSHNLVPLIVFPVLAVWILYHHHNLKSLLLPSLLFLLLTSYFFLPLLFERSFVQVDKIARTTDFHLHFVVPWQLWNSTWGFGGSAPGVEDGLSFKLGKLQILLGLAGLLYLLKSKKTRYFGLLLGLSTLFAFWMTTRFSLPLWQATKYLAMIQFPWRYLTLLGFLLAFLSGFSLKWLPLIFCWPVFIFLTLALFFFNLKYFRPQTNLNITDAFYIKSDYIPHTLAHIIPEYLPTWMPTFPNKPAPNFIQNFASYNLHSLKGKYYLTLNTPVPQKLVINKAYYPTWRATLDNQSIPLFSTKAGLIQLSVPQGQHSLTLYQSHTLLEKLSFYISTITLIYIVIKLLAINH